MVGSVDFVRVLRISTGHGALSDGCPRVHICEISVSLTEREDEGSLVY